MASTSKTSDRISGYLKKIIGIPVGEIITLSSGLVVIGRNRQSAQICIQDPNVSRNHCALKCNENGWFIKDLKSVNGTYLDGNVLIPEKPYPLKDGAGIYLGPPGEAPVAFIFLTNMPNEQSCEIKMEPIKAEPIEPGLNQIHRGETTCKQVLVSNKNNNCMKRQSDSEASNTNECFSQRKKIAISSSLPSSVLPPKLPIKIEDDGSLSDCSISSLDSLKTRVRKMSARKDKSRNQDTINAASTSASPQLRSARNAILECEASTSAFPVEMLNSRRKVKKPIVSKELALLREMFDESESSTPDTIKAEDDSQSLLNDSKILFECEPYPFSQSLPSEVAQSMLKKNTNKESEERDSIEEQLQKATLELKKIKKDKVSLYRLVKELRFETKKKFQFELQRFLEDELMCTICTEVFMKAVTLGCSHTFCEYCICEWKKKQKKCPICREKITSESNVLVLDSFISKTVEQLDPETQNRRKALITKRENEKVLNQKKNKRSRGRGRRRQNNSSDGELNNIAQQILHQTHNIPVAREVVDYYFTSDNSDSDDESDMSVDGSGYYGGYGRCFTCGRRGHWSNGCPY